VDQEIKQSSPTSHEIVVQHNFHLKVGFDQNLATKNRFGFDGDIFIWHG